MKYTGDAIQVTCDVADIAHDALSSTHSDTLAGAVVLGDIIHGNATPKWARLAGNTTAVKQFLSQTGTGSASAVPAWSALPSATDTVAGIVELATDTETNTGTATDRAITPANLAAWTGASTAQSVVIDVVYPSTSLIAGNGQAYYVVPIELTGMNLVSIGAHVFTAGSSGDVTVMVHNLTDTQDMLSAGIGIAQTKNDSSEAGGSGTINTSYDDVVTGDVLRIDIDAIGTDAKGLQIRLGFELP